MVDDVSKLSVLGNREVRPEWEKSPASLLETFPNQYPHRDYWVRHDCPEFTSLCPKTGQPDFANITIEVVPNSRCVETKSLKIYLGSFRNEGAFMETLTNRILEDIICCMEPRRLRITAKFNTRGGISTTVMVEYAP